jgi:hypothetical protein
VSVAENAGSAVGRSSVCKQQPVTCTPVGNVISKATDASNENTPTEIEAIITKLFSEWKLQKGFLTAVVCGSGNNKGEVAKGRPGGGGEGI